MRVIGYKKRSKIRVRRLIKELQYVYREIRLVSLLKPYRDLDDSVMSMSAACLLALTFNPVSKISEEAL